VLSIKTHPDLALVIGIFWYMLVFSDIDHWKIIRVSDNFVRRKWPHEETNKNVCP
jgi:hypothetical protein